MNIKKFAQITNLSPYTLRYYEKIGLILNLERDGSGYRRYSEKDIEWIEFLKKLKATGMPLKTMKTFAQLRNTGEKTASSISARIIILEEHEKKLQKDLLETQNFLDNIKNKIKFYKKQLQIKK
jgi:DNA-binding transcriptional MerR regulator